MLNNITETIAEYYKDLEDFTPNERFSDRYSTVYTSPDSDCWLVLERKGENSIQARVTNDVGLIVSWDDYVIKNDDIKLVDTLRLSANGRNQVLFAPTELLVIDKYGESDRIATMEKLHTLSKQSENSNIKETLIAAIDGLRHISDQSFIDMCSVVKRRQEVEKGHSICSRIEKAKLVADKHNMERATPGKERGKGMEI